MCLNKTKAFLFQKGTCYCATDAVYFWCLQKRDRVIQKLKKNQGIIHLNKSYSMKIIIFNYLLLFVC